MAGNVCFTGKDSKNMPGISRPMIFLDDGGVMNDNKLRGPQWQRLVAEFFVPLLGGEPERWSEANRIQSERIFDLGNWRTRVEAASDHASFDHAYQIDWLAGMCALVGVLVPSEETCFELGHLAEEYVCKRVHAAYPGAVEAIQALHRQGTTLHTASGEPSWSLNGYLQAMGVRDCFGRLYGPDLINTLKEGPAYYERLFADIGIEPANAIIVDDLPRAIDWAAQAGAQTVLVGSSLAPETMATRRIKSLAELPALIQQWDAHPLVNDVTVV
jgi:HAD superfamily hydrolase (TIGR01509 family)